MLKENTLFKTYLPRNQGMDLMSHKLWIFIEFIP